MIKTAFLAAALRIASAASRLLLVLYIARVADAQLLGQVAILVTVNTVFTQIAGLELSQVIGRQLHALHPEDQSTLLQRQACVCIVMYLLLVPASLLAYSEILAPHWLAVGFILVLEHFITEVYRINIILLNPVIASGILFIKNCGWVMIFMTLTATGFMPPSFELLVQCWVAVLAITATPLLLKAKPKTPVALFKSFVHEWQPTVAMLREAVPFVGSAVAVASIGSIDKILIGDRFSLAELGTYYFFFTYSSALTLLVTFGVGSIVGARCIRTHALAESSEYQHEWRQLNKLYLLAAGLTAAALATLAKPLLNLIGKTDYVAEIGMLYALIGSAALVVCCEPYKLDEYLARRDGSLLLGNLLHFAILLASLELFSSIGDIHHVAIGVLTSSAVTFLLFKFRVPRWLDRLLTGISSSHGK